MIRAIGACLVQGVPGLIVHAAQMLKKTGAFSATDPSVLTRLEQWRASPDCAASIQQWKQEAEADVRNASVLKAARPYLQASVPAHQPEDPAPQDRYKPSRFHRWKKSLEEADSGTFFSESKAKAWMEVDLGDFRSSCGRLFNSITKNIKRPIADSELDWIVDVMKERADWDAEYKGSPAPHASRPDCVFMTEEMFVQQVSWLEQAGLLIEELGVRSVTPCLLFLHERYIDGFVHFCHRC